MKLKLRDYQQDLIDRTRLALSNNQAVILQAPTGAGKTALTVYMMLRARERGLKAMFIVHQNELLSQTSKSMINQELYHGFIASGKSYSRTQQIQLASVQTLARRLDKVDEPELIIIDESHRAAAGTYKKVIEAFPKAKVIGLTATPQRTDGQGLGELFSDIVLGPPIRWLMDEGYLAEYELLAPKFTNTDGIKKLGGEFNSKESEGIVDKPAITGNAVTHYRKFANGKRCVVMCVSIKHAKHVAAEYNANGIPAASIEGTMTDQEREAVLEKFAKGELLVITNVQLLVEGVDIPAIEVVQWLRPTASLIIWMQGNGRGLRPFKGKDRLIILDHVGNWERHGLPDEEREWSLEGKEKKGSKRNHSEEEMNIRMCKGDGCFMVMAIHEKVCPKCGLEVQTQGRVIEEVEGELEKIDLAQMRKQQRREQGQAKGLRDLVELGLKRGMKNPSGWAANVFASRKGKRAKPTDYNEAKKLLKELQQNEVMY